MAGSISEPGEEGGRGCNSLVSLRLLGVERVLLRPGDDMVERSFCGPSAGEKLKKKEVRLSARENSMEKKCS